jgi:hypothetical protein
MTRLTCAVAEADEMAKLRGKVLAILPYGTVVSSGSAAGEAQKRTNEHAVGSSSNVYLIPPKRVSSFTCTVK